MATTPRDLIQFRFDDRADHLAARVGADLGVIGHQQDGLQQIADALLLLGRDRHHQRLPAPVIRDEFLLSQLLFHEFRIGVWFVNLIERHNDRDARRLGVRDGFLGLRHDAVVRGHHQHHHVRALCAAGAHGCECRVTGRIKESNEASLLLHLVRADVLGDAPRLARGHIRLADHIQQGGLAMIHVSQDGHHRGAPLEQGFVLARDHLPPHGNFANFLPRDLEHFQGNCLESILGHHNRRRVKIHGLIDGSHDTIRHQFFDDINRAFFNNLRQVTNDNIGR